MSDDKPDYISEFGKCYITGDAMSAYKILDEHSEIASKLDGLVLLRLIGDLIRDEHEDSNKARRRVEQILNEKEGISIKNLGALELLAEIDRAEQLGELSEEE